MALGYLFILFVFIILISTLGILGLYFVKNQKAKNILFYALFAWSLVISFMNVTSLPNNYIFQRVFGLFIGILSIVSVLIKLKFPNKTNIAYLVMSLSIALSVFGLIF